MSQRNLSVGQSKDRGTSARQRSALRFGVYTTMAGMPWGGSEELWSHAATVLLARNHEVTVNAPRWSKPPTQLAALADAGASISWRRRRALYGRSIRRAVEKLGLVHPQHQIWLSRTRPDFVLINAGHHLDDLSIGDACRNKNIPYAILLQAAGASHWVSSSMLEAYRRVYQCAARCFFVSRENLEIVESNLGMALENAALVDNPVANLVEGCLTWPSGSRLSLACVGRIHFQSKGQDLLVRIFRDPKWQDRELTVHFYGEDDGSERQLRDLICLAGLEKKLLIRGFVEGIQDIWRRHHGLLLASRYEGSSLAVAEAMCAGRVPIVTEVGRNGELVQDGWSGFLAAAAVPRLLDDALERAWQRREAWPQIGEHAAQRLAKVYSNDPAGDFASALEDSAKFCIAGARLG